MKLNKVVINNYKSFGKDENIVYIEDNITTLIGKNESGKSNLVELLNKISLIDGVGSKILGQKNRKNLKDEVSIILDFIINEKKIQGNCKFTFKEEDRVMIEGAISNYIENEHINRDILRVLNDHKSLLTLNFSQNQINNIYGGYIKAIENLNMYIFKDYKGFYSNMKSWCNKINDVKEKEEVIKINEEFFNKLSEIYNLFPIFYLYTERTLEDSYICNQEFFEKFESNNSVFKDLLKAANISKDMLYNAMDNSNPGISEDYKDEIKSFVEEKIEREFNRFYNQETIKLRVRLEQSKFILLVETDKNKMSLSERSNGLRWYLNMFINIKANDLLDKHVIYLIDEPAVYLHVEAQKKVIKLFEELAQDKNQLIYTTHSPFMIDSDKLIRIKALEKNNGITKVFNKVWDQNLSEYSKEDTLSPLLSAIGSSVRFNLGPNDSKLNLITEGITDYMYISAMAKYLNIDDINIIPSIGASKVSSLVSIMIGWGCKYKAILDYDRAGHEEAKKLNKHLGLEVNKDYFYVNCQDEYKGDNETIENIIDRSDYKKIGYEVFDNSKKLLVAKTFNENVSNNRIELSEKTVSKFKKLFENIGVL